MEKALLYTNKFEDMERMINIHNFFAKNGYEVAFSTDISEIAKLMAIGFLTVVKFNTYYPSVVVTNEKVKADNVLSIEQVEEMMNSE